MVNVIGVRFMNAGKLYYFDPGANWPTPGDYVVVETTRGMELGEVVMPVQQLDENLLASPLRPVIRVATAQDVQHNLDNRAAEKEAFAICQKKIEDHQLEMKLVSAEYTFDNSKILFNFTANGRVDFRSLVKDLASVFHTRIELRQIGARDEAKMLGGLGPCGRPICCGSFLGDIQPVSIKMAKEQNLSLNPTKISGICGRLMCCLKYEEETYEQARKRMPRVGREVMTPDGVGTVTDLNIIRETVKVRINRGDSSELREYPLESLGRTDCCCRCAAQPAAAADSLEEMTAASPTAAPADAPMQAPTEPAVQAPIEAPQQAAEEAVPAMRQQESAAAAPAREPHRRERRAARAQQETSAPRAPQEEQPSPAAQTAAASPAPQADAAPAQPSSTRRNWRQALLQAKQRASMGNSEKE